MRTGGSSADSAQARTEAETWNAVSSGIHQSRIGCGSSRGGGALVFVDLLPAVAYPSDMDRALRTFVAGRASADLPAHRRIDPKKASCRCRNRAGNVSIEVRCLDGDFEYTANKAVKLVNEVFLNFLAGPYDGYMIEHFGAPEE